MRKKITTFLRCKPSSIFSGDLAIAKSVPTINGAESKVSRQSTPINKSFKELLRKSYKSDFLPKNTINSQLLVSAITVFFNCENYIEEAIESVLAQTYDNWELLLVDDGSTDGSTAIALRYAEKYPTKVRYLEHPNHENRGMSATRNLGIRNAKGEYIAFLDADNVWLPQKLEQQVATMRSQPEADIVFGLAQYWYSWTGNPEDRKRDFLRQTGIPSNELFHPPKLLSLLLQDKATIPATCSILIRRKILEEIGGFEEAFRGMYEDQAFFAKVYLKARVFVETTCWEKYRQHPDSTCAIAKKTGQYDPQKKLNPGHQNFLKWMAEYLSKQEIKDVEIWQSLEKGLWPYRCPKLYSLCFPLLQIFTGIKYQFNLIWQRELTISSRESVSLDTKP